LLKADFPALQPIKIHLHKNIPIGAGLGGGSADAAFSLKALNQLQGLGLSREVLEAYALALGSDCPFFIANEPKIAKGRGEIFEDVQINLSGWQILLVFPGIHVSTKEAYTGITPKKADYNLTGTLSQSPENWRGVIKNDFEPVVFDKYPAIAAIKNEMYEIGAVYASMSGTGSCVYGIFPVHVDIPQPASWQNYTICVSSHP
jgi:4-diphosphocytidyl-2-C-methyl-D-erythritol kinase